MRLFNRFVLFLLLFSFSHLSLAEVRKASGRYVSLTVDSGMFVSDGSATTPSVSFASDNDGTGTGLYRVGANSLGFAANGVNVGQYSATGNWTFGNQETEDAIHTFPGQAEFRRRVVIGNTSTSYPGTSTSGISLLRISAESSAKLQLEDRGQSANSRKMELEYAGGTFAIRNINDADNAPTIRFSISSAGALTLGTSGGTQTHTVNGKASLSSGLTFPTAYSGSNPSDTDYGHVLSGGTANQQIANVTVANLGADAGVTLTGSGKTLGAGLWMIILVASGDDGQGTSILKWKFGIVNTTASETLDASGTTWRDKVVFGDPGVSSNTSTGRMLVRVIRLSSSANVEGRGRPANSGGTGTSDIQWSMQYVRLM